MAGHGPIPTKVRVAVDQRDNRQCLRCGAAGREIHHRMRRREGGHALSVCILLCSACHRWAHANPVHARAGGFIIPTWSQQPATDIPVAAFYGTVTLDDEGGVTWTAPHTA
jgi:5-methylcytosine-specific restriction endonuclease McrA